MLSPMDLANLPFVSFPRGAPLRFQIDRIFDRLSIERILSVEATSHHAIRRRWSLRASNALVNPFAPIDGYPTQLVARPMKPSLMIEMQMLWNDSSTSIGSTGFREFVLQAAAKRVAQDSVRQTVATIGGRRAKR